MNRCSVFIGSSSEGIEVARAIQSELVDDDTDVSRSIFNHLCHLAVHSNALV